MSLTQALGRMAGIPQFFVWRLVWDGDKNKFEKTPCTPEGPWIVDASKPQNWRTYDHALQLLDWHRHADPENRYALGFWLTAECGLWFLDLDRCITADRQYTPIADQLLKQLAGCFFEFSSSGNGAHVIGSGTVPAHSMRNKDHGLELYTEQRGIAFGTTGEAWGSADVGSPAIASIASLYFAPRAAGEAGEFDHPRADWRGPADDAELIRRAMASESVASRMGHRASFAQLWTNAPELERFYGPDSSSERDAALAAHLAFWTGCDGPRIERLMRGSALARPKWDEHRTYLRDLTINSACARCKDVYQEPKRVDPATMYQFTNPAVPQIDATALGGLGAPQSVLVSAEAKSIIDRLLDMIHGATTWEEMHNSVIPAVRDAGVPNVLMSRIENAIKKRLELWDDKMPVAKLRALISPPRLQEASDSLVAKPDWMERYVYLKQGDKFHDTHTGVGLTRTSFNAMHDRDMPIKNGGPMREDAVQWALHVWGVKLVHDAMYYPGQPVIFDYDGFTWANSYTESSHPHLENYTQDGIDAINRFAKHLHLLCGYRQDVFDTLVAWMAHNVQRPGKKIRWCPVIKGTEGDGKTMIASVLNAAMGGRNVSFIGPDIVANSGGFTDWAHGKAVVALEEMYLGGKERYRIANAMKPYISNNKVSINGKGDKPRDVNNTCDQIAFTNYGDAVPIESERDRRWMVIFTPFQTRQQMNLALGYANDTEAEKHFDAIFDSMQQQPGQWRRWLLEYQIPATFSANRGAISTDEKSMMANNGIDDVESLARSIVDDGAHGVSKQVLSSACLTSAMRQRSFAESVDIPKGQSVHHLLNRMGFNKVSESLWWNGSAHRVWVKPGVDKSVESLRGVLDLTLNSSLTVRQQL